MGDASSTGSAVDAGLQVVDRFVEAVAQLRSARTTAELLASISSAVITLGFERAMVSSVEEEVWRPHAVRIDADDDWSERVERTALRNPQRIAQSVPERHAIRHLAPVLVPPPRDVHVWSRAHWDFRHPRTVAAYVASPIVGDGRVLGIVHADRGSSCRPLDYADVSLLWSFCGVADMAFSALAATDHLDLRPAGPEGAARRSDLPDLPAGVRPDRLTPRERDVIELVAQGLGNAEIARRLSLTEGTVKSHVKHVLAKTGSPNRTTAALAWSAHRTDDGSGLRG